MGQNLLHTQGGGGGGMYGVVRMCGPNSPFFQLRKYTEGPFFRVW